jgi:hypothetical protein
VRGKCLGREREAEGYGDGSEATGEQRFFHGWGS